MEKIWHIGIDFGTTNTYVVAYNNKTRKFYTQSIGAFFDKKLVDADNHYNIPTVIAFGWNKSGDATVFFVGNEAIVAGGA